MVVDQFHLNNILSDQPHFGQSYSPTVEKRKIQLKSHGVYTVLENNMLIVHHVIILLRQLKACKSCTISLLFWSLEINFQFHPPSY